ncbi:MAG: Arm DNA-binding domain-containing protein [Egibacteraceae bacterium]
MAGSVFRRCTSKGCQRRGFEAPRAKTCSFCGGESSAWSYVVDVARPGRPRKQEKRGGFATKKEAEAARRLVVGDVEDGRHVARSGVSTGAYLRRWLAGLARKDSTLANYRTSLEAYAIPGHCDECALGGIPLQDLGPEDLDRLYRHLERGGNIRARKAGRPQGLKPNIVRHVHTAMHKALADAVERGHVKSNAAALADPPTQRQARSRKAQTDIWTPEQLRAFHDSVVGDRLYAGWLVLMTTGMRRGELCGLAWPAIDFDAGELWVRQTLLVIDGQLVWRCMTDAEPTKTEAGERPIALDAAPLAALKAHKLAQRRERLAAGPAWHEDLEHGPLVFTRGDGRPVHPVSWLDRLQRRARKLARVSWLSG